VSTPVRRSHESRTASIRTFYVLATHSAPSPPRKEKPLIPSLKTSSQADKLTYRALHPKALTLKRAYYLARCSKTKTLPPSPSKMPILPTTTFSNTQIALLAEVSCSLQPRSSKPCSLYLGSATKQQESGLRKLSHRAGSQMLKLAWPMLVLIRHSGSPLVRLQRTLNAAATNAYLTLSKWRRRCSSPTAKNLSDNGATATVLVTKKAGGNVHVLPLLVASQQPFSMSISSSKISTIPSMPFGSRRRFPMSQ